ncbi:MAG TPA: hypothetical protein VNH12_03035 [Burkholderiales bacterium]|nr:hypothetical protein [Burkholderiales bacterium]
MTQHPHPHRGKHALAPLPEELAPAEAAHQLDQRGVVACDDRTALVEDRQQVAKAAAPAVLQGNLLRVQRVQAGLGARESEPGQRVEHIVQVPRPARHASGAKGAQLVVLFVDLRRDEAQRRAACDSQAGLRRGLVQPLQAGQAAAEPATHGLEDGMG